MNTLTFPQPVVLILFVLLASGCATAKLSPEDQALKKRVQAEVAHYSDIIEVSAVNGRVYLSGNCVETYGLANEVEDVVKHMDGVKDVANSIVTCGDRDGDDGSNWP